MRSSLALLFMPLAMSVSALKVIEPNEGAIIDSSKSLDVKWTSVDTDASAFNIYLVNNAVYPPVNKKIASGVDTSKDSYTIKNLDATAGHGYQINLVSDVEKNTGILAQSQQFNVTDSAQSSRTSSSTTSAFASTDTTSTSTTETTIGSSFTTTSTSTTGITKTASSASGSASKIFSSATPTPSTGAGTSLIANPAAVAGIFAGAVAFAL